MPLPCCSVMSSSIVTVIQFSDLSSSGRFDLIGLYSVMRLLIRAFLSAMSLPDSLRNISARLMHSSGVP